MKTPDSLIVYPSNDEQLNVVKTILEALKVKFELTENVTSNPEFVAKIQKARQDYNNGKGKEYTSEQLKALS